MSSCAARITERSEIVNGCHSSGYGFWYGLGQTETAWILPLVVHLARRAELPGPLQRRPALDAVERRGHLVVEHVALVAEGVLRPRHLHDLQDLAEDVEVAGVGPAEPSEPGGGGLPALAEHVHPPVLVAAGHAQAQPALAELVEQRHVLRRPDRVPGGQHEAERGQQDALGALAARSVRNISGLTENSKPSEWKWCSVIIERVEADLVGVDRDLTDLVEQLLIGLDVPPDRPLGDRVLLAGVSGTGDLRVQEDRELHGSLLSQLCDDGKELPRAFLVQPVAAALPGHGLGVRILEQARLPRRLDGVEPERQHRAGPARQVVLGVRDAGRARPGRRTSPRTPGAARAGAWR